MKGGRRPPGPTPWYDLLPVMPTSDANDGYVFYDGVLLGIVRPIFALFDRTKIHFVRYNEGMMLHITDNGDFEETPYASGITPAFLQATGLRRTAQDSAVITSINRDEFVYKAVPL